MTYLVRQENTRSAGHNARVTFCTPISAPVLSSTDERQMAKVIMERMENELALTSKQSKAPIKTWQTTLYTASIN